MKKETQHGILNLFSNFKNNPRDRGAGRRNLGGSHGF